MIKEEIFLGITCLHCYSYTLVTVLCCSHLCKTFVFIFMYVEIRVAHLLQDIRCCIQTRVGIHTEVGANFAVKQEKKPVLLRLLFEPWSLPFVSKSPEASVSKRKKMLWEVTIQCKWCHGYKSWGIIFVALSPSWKCPIKPEGKWDLFYHFFWAL